MSSSSSINSFKLHLQTQNHTNLRHATFKQPQTNTKISIPPTTKPLLSLKTLTKPQLPHTPISLKTQPFPPPHQKISKLVLLKSVYLLIGSFLYLGCLHTKPVLALPVEKASVSEHIEEKEDEEMEKVLEKNPRDVEALKVVLYGKIRKGKNKEAVEYVERLIDIEPNEIEWRLLQALCYEMMGHLSTAKRLFKEILEERPLLLRALHGLAMVMHKNREGSNLFEMLNKALGVAQREKRVTEERNIRILIAQMHVVKGEMEEALNKFQCLIDENPRDFRPYLCQGIVYSLLDKKKEAEECFETYRSLVPEEFPQRGFLDDVVLEAKTKSRERLKKEFDAEFSYRR